VEERRFSAAVNPLKKVTRP